MSFWVAVSRLGRESSLCPAPPRRARAPPVSHAVALSVIRSTVKAPQGLCSTNPCLTSQHSPQNIHMTFITVCCYNRSVLLLVIVVNLLPSLICKLNFITGYLLKQKSIIYIGLSPICSFRHLLGVLECITPQKRGDYYTKRWQLKWKGVGGQW